MSCFQIVGAVVVVCFIQLGFRGFRSSPLRPTGFFAAAPLRPTGFFAAAPPPAENPNFLRWRRRRRWISADRKQKNHIDSYNTYTWILMCVVVGLCQNL